MKPPFLWLLVGSGLCLALSMAPAQDPNQKQAQKIVKQTLAAAVKSHGKALVALLAPATSVLKDSKAALASGASAPGDSAAALAGVMTSLDVSLCDTTRSTVLNGASIGVDDALSVAGLPLPDTALAGTGGVLDKQLARIAKRHRAAEVKGRKASHLVVHALTQVGQPAALRTPDTHLPAFAPGFFDTGPSPDVTASVIALPTLQLTALVGHSDGDNPGDGSLRIAGFTKLTDDVLLSGKGPDGAWFAPIAVTPNADGTFEATVTDLVEGNWRVQAIQFVAMATDYVGIPGAPDPGTDSVTPAQAAKEARKAWKQLDKQHAVTLKQDFKTYKAALKAARKALKAGADPLGVVEDVYAALETLQVSLEAATNGATGLGGMAASTFGGTLDGLDQLVDEQLVGFGLSNDKVSARVDKRLQQRATKAVHAARAFGRTLAKKSDVRMAVDEAAVPFYRAAPVKGPELPALSVPLRIELLMGSSEEGVDVDGVIRLRLSGDDSLGPRANLGLFGPDGVFLFHDINSPDLIGGLDLRFPAEGPGDLPEGNYVAVLQQGSMVVSAAISVPGGG